MDAFETTNAGRPSLGWYGILGLGLISLAVYCSVFLIWLTPLPILYAYRFGPKMRSIAAVLPPFLLLCVCYLVLVPLVTANFGTDLTLKVFFWLPGIGLTPGEVSTNSSLFGILYFLFFAMMGAVLGELEPMPFSMTRTMAIALLLLVLALGLWLFLYTFGDFAGFIDRMQGYFAQIIREVTQVPPANEEMRPQWAFFQSHADSIAQYMIGLMPAMVLNMVIFTVWLNIIVARRIFGGPTAFFVSLGPLRCWRLPFFGVWLVIGSAFLWILDSYVFHVEWLKIAALNVFLVFALIYFFQGLAIVSFYLSRWALSPMIRLLLYSLLILFFQPLMSILLMAFGFFDSWFDFRRLTPKSA